MSYSYNDLYKEQKALITSIFTTQAKIKAEQAKMESLKAKAFTFVKCLDGVKKGESTVSYTPASTRWQLKDAKALRKAHPELFREVEVKEHLTVTL